MILLNTWFLKIETLKLMLLHEHLFSNTRKITFGHIKIDWPHETLTGPGFCGHLRSYLWDFSGPVPTFPLARKIRTDASAKSLTTIRKRGCETLREVQGDRWSNQIFNFIQEQFTDPLNEVGVQRVPWAAGLKVHVENGHYTCQQKNSSFLHFYLYEISTPVEKKYLRYKSSLKFQMNQSYFSYYSFIIFHNWIFIQFDLIYY